MRIFDTFVQKIKHTVLCALIKNAYEDCYENIYIDLPKQISPGPHAELRCCIYKERAIVQERIKLALGKSSDANVIRVIDIACEECPAGGAFVTESCRGCISHKCIEVCPCGAITAVGRKALIDKNRCIECGKCVKACPFSAISVHKRPCVMSCKLNAISMDANKKAVINYDKCVDCGACIYQCPFGAISDESQITDVINLLQGSNNGANYKLYAVVAPSIASQFKYTTTGRVISGIKKLGFFDVVEAALGADITLKEEADEFKEKGVLLSSCCPSFVMYVEKNFPDLSSYISQAVSPMIKTAQLIKSKDKTAKVIFIGPCASKQHEYKLEKANNYIDSVMSFEELQAFFDARNIDVTSLDETPLSDASYYGRIFAHSGGVSKGIAKLAQNVKAVNMSGLDECKLQLQKLRAGKSDYNFFEGMTCEGGCINGPLCMGRGTGNFEDVDKYANSSNVDLDGSAQAFLAKGKA